MNRVCVAELAYDWPFKPMCPSVRSFERNGYDADEDKNWERFLEYEYVEAKEMMQPEKALAIIKNEIYADAKEKEEAMRVIEEAVGKQIKEESEEEWLRLLSDGL